jgi:hypothetical protein
MSSAIVSLWCQPRVATELTDRLVGPTQQRGDLARGLSTTTSASFADGGVDDGAGSAAAAGTRERWRPDHVGVWSCTWRPRQCHGTNDSRSFVFDHLSNTGRDVLNRSGLDCQNRR